MLQQRCQALVGKHSLNVCPLTPCQGQVTLPHQLAQLLPELEDARQQLGAVGKGTAVQDVALIRLQQAELYMHSFVSWGHAMHENQWLARGLT
jgi:hypothetical protein